MIWRIGTSYFAVMNMAPGSYLAADNMTKFMTWEIVNMGPFNIGIGSSSARNTLDPARLWPLDSFWKRAYECAESTILMALYTIPLLG